MNHLIAFAILSLFAQLPTAAQIPYDLSLSKLEKLAYPDEGDHADAGALKSAYDQFRADWLLIPENERRSHHPEYFVQMAVRYAELAMQHRAVNAAGSALSDAITEAERQSITIGATKGGTSALEDTAKVVASIWSATGINPIEGKENNFAFAINKFDLDFIVIARGTPDFIADETGLPPVMGVPPIPNDEDIGYFSKIRNVDGESRLLERGYVSFLRNGVNATLFDCISSIYQFKASGVHGPPTFIQHKKSFANYLSSVGNGKELPRKYTGTKGTPLVPEKNINAGESGPNFKTKNTIVGIALAVVMSLVYLMWKNAKK